MSDERESLPNPFDRSAVEEKIKQLCEHLGYGHVMQVAADIWRRKDPVGALTVGPCVGMLNRVSPPKTLTRDRVWRKHTNQFIAKMLLREWESERDEETFKVGWVCTSELIRVDCLGSPIRLPPNKTDDSYIHIRIKRPEGYEDVHPDLVLEDFMQNPYGEWTVEVVP